MNQLKFWHIALLLSIWSLTSCSDDNNENEAITPFCLGDTYYEVRLGQETNSIYITNGSGDISLAIEDENILQATYNGKLYADKPGGVVSLFGKQKGSTMLSIIAFFLHSRKRFLPPSAEILHKMGNRVGSDRFFHKNAHPLAKRRKLW